MNITAENRRWQEESDARTLAEAATIKADAKRMAGAENAAKRILVEKEAEMKGLKAIAGKKAVESKPVLQQKAKRDSIGDFVLPRY